MADDPHARRIAGHLLRIGAVALSPDDPFTWASGLKSPIYCDNRLTMSYPEVRRDLTDGFASILTQHQVALEVIVGTATAGIPHAAWLAHRLSLPMAYVRSKPKAHGRGNQIEGKVEPGQQVVIVEDLISTGMSSMAVVRAVRDAGIKVSALLGIFSYGLAQSVSQFADAGVPVFTLTDFDTLLDVAREQGAVAPDAVRSLQAWRLDPPGWSAERGGKGLADV